MRRRAVIAALLAAALSGALLWEIPGPLAITRSDAYVLFVFPEPQHPHKHARMGPYDSLATARRAAAHWMQKYPSGDYVIGIGAERAPDTPDEIAARFR